MHKTVYVYTDDPDNAVIILTVSGRVVSGKDPKKDKPRRNEFIDEFNKLYRLNEQ
jgi:hypothetical protein